MSNKLILIITIFCGGLLIQCNGSIISEKHSHRQSTGSMLAEIAKELVERSKNTNQILNLNLSNLLLLLLLKAVVYGANFIGKSDYKGRGYEKEPVVSEEEIALALGYLIGDTCLYRAACEVPTTAKNYLDAVEMVFQTMKFIPESLPIDKNYEKTIAEFRKAIDYGSTKSCPPEYNCKKENINNFLRPE